MRALLLAGPCLWFSGGLIAHSDLELQIQRLDQALSEQPADAELLIKRGDLHRRHEDYELAGQDFDRARQADPGHQLLDFMQGRLALEQGNFQSAAQLLQKFLVTQPRHPGAWRLLARAQNGQGQLKQSAESYTHAINFSESPSPALFSERIDVLLSEDPPDYEAALETVDQALARFGPEVTLLGLGTDAAIASGRAGQAGRYLSQLPEGLQALPQWSSRRAALDQLNAH